MNLFIEFNEEVKAWEKTLQEKHYQRIYKTAKVYRCPRKEKYLDYRHHRGSGYYCRHECKDVRIRSHRQFRRKYKWVKDYENTDFTPVPHDYKTYGWVTW